MRLFCVLTVLASNLIFSSGAAPLPEPGPTPKAPPVSPPILSRPERQLHSTDAPAAIAAAAAPVQYSIGEPTDEEQLYLEFINRARMNPAGEAIFFRDATDPDILNAYAFFGTDLNLMVQQFALIPPAPPVALNAQLTAAARLHSLDMFVNDWQQHLDADGKGVGERVAAQGYPFTQLSENIFSFATSVFQGHAGFEVDWGDGPGGMQTPPGHRITIHNPAFREVGIGVFLGRNTNVGPQLVTQDFANRSGLTPLVLGVAFYDLNGNDFYDLGEGIGGVDVRVSNANFFAVTAGSGGYTVPVPANGTYTVTFSAPGLGAVEQTVTVSDNANVQVNFAPVYNPPVISGSPVAFINQNNVYRFTEVGGATAYQWKQTKVTSFTAVEGAENGTGRVTAEISEGYELLDTAVKASGTRSFHLAHAKPVNQILTFNPVLRAHSNSELLFKARLGFATPSQIAKAQISTDGGQTWLDIWSKAGTGDSGDANFNQETVSLSAFADKEFKLRFVYIFTSGTFFPQSSPGVGFYIDDVSFTETDELTNEIVADVPNGAQFIFSPSEAANFALAVRPKISNRFFNWGPALDVRSEVGQLPPTIRITGVRRAGATQVEVEFEVTNPPTASNFKLETAASVNGPWSTDANAQLEAIVGNSKFRAVSQTGNAAFRLYRISFVQ
ncbi:MAG: carboxypeptidase regulatory-like domain-containing protein [Verrucomicrobiota bacterium]